MLQDTPYVARPLGNAASTRASCFLSNRPRGLTLRDKRRLAPAESHASHHGPPGAQAAPPADRQRSASSPGWTDRVPTRPDQVCLNARYGGYSGVPHDLRPVSGPTSPRAEGAGSPAGLQDTLQRGTPPAPATRGASQGGRQAHHAPGRPSPVVS